MCRKNNRAQDAAARLLADFEGLALVPYQDEGGVWTVGYGHCCGARHDPVTKEEAGALLLADIRIADSALSGLLLSDWQRAALICFIFNVGKKAFEISTMRRLLVARRMDEAADEFGRWVHVGKGDARRVCHGLVNRRAAERSIFLRGAL